MHVLPPALAPLGAYRQFILYRLVPDGAKTAKKPLDPRTLRVSDPHNSESWVTFDEAAALLPALGAGHGVGFVFTAADPFWFLDVDGAWDGSKWNAAANEAWGALAGCAVEVSSSGRGLHFFGTGAVPAHSTRNGTAHLEFYTDKRFVALTGTNATGDAAYAPPSIAEYVGRYFPTASAGAAVSGEWWSSEPVPAWRGPTDDDILIDRALKSRSAAGTFGGKATFVQLWEADGTALAQHFPSDRDTDPYNASNVDAALAQHLCFWTGNDAARIERLMRRSGLVRGKWDDREDYLPRTIRKACSMQVEFLADAPPSASPFATEAKRVPVTVEPVRITESTFLSPTDQIEFFRGVVYVLDDDKFFLPTGRLVDATRFNRAMGGRMFSCDAANSRTTRKAAEAFTENQEYKFPRADGSCFRPRSDPGTIIVEGGRSLVNTWVPVNVPRAKGDVSRFTAHIAKMVPDEEDQRTLIYYMAGSVQMQGVKFQWAPLIQGTTGNGKSMLSQVVRKAIGKEYCHTPRAKGIDNDFNAWMDGRTFYSVDEIYIPDKRLNILETLKEMITSDEQEVTKKGVDSGTRDVCGNFMFFTNHRDGIRKNRHDRRIAPFYTAQQVPEDLIRDGLTELYYRDLVAWLKGQHEYAGQPTGYSVLAEWLWTMEIPERYNPATMPRAPRTSSTEAAIVASRGPIEQDIVEAIEQAQPGFRGGWISSLMLKRLVNEGGHRVSLSVQAEFVVNLGYVQHPALRDGRVNNEVAPDAGKPRLFVRSDASHLLRLNTAAEVAHAYVTAQLGKG